MQKMFFVHRIYILKIVLCIFTFSTQANTQNGNFQVDIHSRENVRSFYNAVYNSSNNVAVDWTGDVRTCNAGDSSQTYKDATLRRINFFRAMAGVPAWITFSASANASAISAALLASANNALSHFPPQSWKCYSSARAQGSASSNIALGKIGANAITAYIEDAGKHNLSVGHRRWLLYPQTRVMGAGDISPQPGTGQKASAITIFDDQFGRARPQTRNQYVTWPPTGFVPYQLIFPRWSFSLANADFSHASVSVTLNNQEIPLEILPIGNGYGENTIVWEINSSELIKPSTDLVYIVEIHNVLIDGRFSKDFNYQVKAFDSAIEGSDTVLSNISGASQIRSGEINQYRVNLTPNVSTHQILIAQRSPYQHIATAEYGLEELKGNATDANKILSNFTSNSGHYSYHLSHRTGVDHQLRFDRQFLINPNSNLVFYSRISCASVDEVARVQVSLDDGNSWQDVYSQPGVLYGLRESGFTARTIDLDAFVGKIIRLRFNYTSQLGWHCNIANSGWYLDDIVLSNVDELTQTQLMNITHTAFQFTADEITDYVLAARGILFNGFIGQWGRAFPVQVVSGASLSSVEAQAKLSPIVKPPTSNNQRTNIQTKDNGPYEACSLDVDNNGSVDALTDGLLFIRHMFGNRGESLIESALGGACTRCTSSEIEIFLDQCAAIGASDIDGNGVIDALTDGLLKIRFIFGIRGAALIDNSVGDNCSRCTATEIETHLDQ
jgi:hypothetical protein